MRSTELPTTDLGEPDFDHMVFAMGLKKQPHIADPSGFVQRVASVDPEVGLAWLEHPSGERHSVDIANLYLEWLEGDLDYRERAFLRDDQYVVDRELLQEALAVTDSELAEMDAVDPEHEGEWTQRVQALAAEIDAVLTGEL